MLTRISKIITICALVLCPASIVSAQHRVTHVEPIPVIQLPYYKTETRPGWEERGPEWIKWLAVGVRFPNGSGTICYFDPETKYAYVISAGHLFSGRSLRYDPNRKPKMTEIDVFYHNERKLDKPKSYPCEVLCYQNFSDSVWDVAICRFKADWDVEWYASIAPKDYKLKKGHNYHSTGCDGLTPVAHYSVKYVEERDRGPVTEIITVENGPRGGRSGGGVMTDDGQLIFICSRGNSYAYWTSLQQIHKFLELESEFEFILNSDIAARVPIHDQKDPTRVFPPGYIPLP